MANHSLQKVRASSSVYLCDNIIQGEVRNPLNGMLPFSRYVLKPKTSQSLDFGGAGLYACFFRDRLVYVGKYQGLKNDFHSGNIISMRWIKHIGTFTMMARNVSFRKKAMYQIYAELKSKGSTIPQPILDAFPAVSLGMITRDRGCVSTYARFDVARYVWQELGDAPTLDWLKAFSFIYTKIDADLPCAEIRECISRAEMIAVSKLRPPGNSIKERSWSTYSIEDVFNVFKDSLSCSHEVALNGTLLSAGHLETIIINEPEEMENGMKFEEKIEVAPDFAKYFVEQVKEEFDSVDNSSIEYTKIPDMRIRKIIKKGKGFVNAVTIRWQPTKKDFVLKTVFSQEELAFFGLNVDVHEIIDPLPYEFCLGEEIINENIKNILQCLIEAHQKREHRGYI